MKRILCIALSLSLMLSLAACSRGKKAAEEEKKTEKVDIATLDGEKLYRYGEEKMRALTSALYTTTVLDGTEELGTIETVRIRKGYDGFIYSRQGQGFYSFDGERAYMENEVGSYTAPTTVRVFEEYMTEFVFPVCGLNPDLLEKYNREGDSVTYESSDAALLALYRLAEKPDFEPKSLSGVAYLDEEGVIIEEKITLKGENGECVLKTVLTEYRSDSIEIAEPTSPDSYTEVEDIGLPFRLQKAILDLYEQQEIQTTATSANTMTLGEASYLFSQDITTYAKEEAGAYYISRQSMEKTPTVPEECLFYQARLTGGQKTEDRYDALLGEKIWENTATADSLPWKTEISAIVPNFSDFETLQVSEAVGGYSVSFKLTEEASKRIAAKVMGEFPECGVVQPVVTVRFGEGTLLVDEARGIVTSLSYSVEGSFISPVGNGEFAGQYSLFVDATEGVSIPEMRVPAPMNPEV